MRILIAGADPGLRSALSHLMRRRLDLYELQDASDMDELRCCATASPPGLLLLDWALPGLRTEKGLAEVREAFPSTRVVVLSIDAEDREAALAGGASGFVYKALAPNEVARIIGDLATATDSARGGTHGPA